MALMQADRYDAALAYKHNFIIEWLADKAPRTRERYKQILAEFMAQVDVPVDEITPSIMKQYHAHLLLSKGSPNTVATHVYALKSFFRYLEEAQITDRNPARILKQKRDSEARVERYLTKKEVEDILAYFTEDHMIGVLLRLLYRTAIRLGKR